MNENVSGTTPAGDTADKILLIFTRTPLHVGAGERVAAVDKPLVRERPTALPIIPGSSLKGKFADAWNHELKSRGFKRVRKGSDSWDDATNAAWLFGSDDANHAFAGAIQFSEARLLAFPVRSAKGSFAWITSPLILRRALRDGALSPSEVDAGALRQLTVADEEVLCADRLLTIPVEGMDQRCVVLEEYTLKRSGPLPKGIGAGFASLIADPVWSEVADRLAVVSQGMMSFFAHAACEIAQHVNISDETGTASEGLLFNQENVPSESLFYSVVHAYRGRGATFKTKQPADAFAALATRLEAANHVLQFGADASTGLGYCTVVLK